MEQRGDQRLGQQQERQRGRYAYQQHHAHRPVQGGSKGLGFLPCMLAGQRRQYHRPYGNTEGTQRQLGETVGVIQPGDAASLQEGGQHRIQQQVDLTDRDAEQRRNHQRHDAPDALVLAIRAGYGQQAYLGQKRQLEQQLHHTGNEYPPGQRQDRLVEIGSHEYGGTDHAQVEQHRSEGRHGKTAIAVEDGAAQGGQGNQDKIGKGGPQHLGRQLQLLGLDRKSTRLNSSHVRISYAVFCLKKKTT